MKPEQVYQFLNDAIKNVLGENATLVSEDFSNIIDVGRSLANADKLDPFYRAIHDVLVRNIYVNRPYDGYFPEIFRESWEWGSILGKVQCDLLDATTNEEWELVNGSSIDPFVINIPKVSQKFYNKGVTFEIDVTKPEEQVKGAFQSFDAMNGFMAMIETQVRNSMELRLEKLVEATINNMIAVTCDTDASARCVHLLTMYKAVHPSDATIQALTSVDAMEDEGFLRYASKIMMLYPKRLSRYSVLFNEAGKSRHTPSDKLHILVHTDFAKTIETNLQSTTYHENLVGLSGYKEVPYWQGCGDDYALSNTESIDVTAVIPDGNGGETTKAITEDNIVAIMFDHDALGILKPERKVKTAYNGKGEYYNDFHKWTSRYFNDFDENFVVFLLD